MVLGAAVVGCTDAPPAATPDDTVVVSAALSAPTPATTSLKRPPPFAHCKNVCAARHIECGPVKQGREVHDCGGCANDNICKKGRCVKDPSCKPDGTSTKYCDGNNLMRMNSCGKSSLINTCANGCAQDACIVARCGDGKLQGNEQCDDGNAIPNDGCSNACKLPRCGDGIVQAGETCDDGNGVNRDQCTNKCRLPRCGDGIVQVGETCDDGNAIDTDKCTNACRSRKCGDGTLQNAEECDDGNKIDDDACSNVCTPNVIVCGDSVVQGSEQCDDGNAVQRRRLHEWVQDVALWGRLRPGRRGVRRRQHHQQRRLQQCVQAAEAAATALVQPGEDCDDGNAVDSDGCTNICLLAVCGDGIVREGGEECDDGNRIDEDLRRRRARPPGAATGSFSRARSATTATA